MDEAGLAQLVAFKLADDLAVAKNIDAVAIFELVHFCRVPDEGAPARRPHRG